MKINYTIPEEMSIKAKGSIIGRTKYLSKGVLKGLPLLQIFHTTSIDLMFKNLGL